MILVDASAMVEALIGRDVDPELLGALAGEIAAPHLLDVDVLAALRALLLGAKLTHDAAEQARRDYFAFTITRHEVAPVADRIWQLRHQHTSYDSCYLAPAEALDAPLYTGDTRLANGSHSAHVLLVPRTR